MSVAIRPLTGVALGFEFAPISGVYFTVYLGIVEVAFYNEEELEDE